VPPKDKGLNGSQVSAIIWTGGSRCLDGILTAR
jgi:hypothetical protein